VANPFIGSPRFQFAPRVYPPERDGRGEYLLWLRHWQSGMASIRSGERHNRHTRRAMDRAQKNLLVFLPRSGNVAFGHRAGGGARVELVARLGVASWGFSSS
jgi:hypothetical protein